MGKGIEDIRDFVEILGEASISKWLNEMFGKVTEPRSSNPFSESE